MSRRTPARAAAAGGAMGAALGLALGAVVAGSGPAPVEPGPLPSVQPSPASAACLEAGEHAERMAALGDEAADAMAQLDARRLEVVVDEMGQADRGVRGALERCRAGQEAEE